MDPSGPVSLLDLDADLELSDEDILDESWTKMAPRGRNDTLVTGAKVASAPTSALRHPTTQASSASKRPISYTSDSNSEPSSPNPKSSRRKDSSDLMQCAPAQLMDSSRGASSLSAPPPPAFAPRADYIKLLFKDNLSVDIKLRWLSKVNRAFQLDREQAEVKMAAITSRFVYISRRRSDIVDRVVSGEFLSISPEVQDSPERSRKFPTYLLTRYPVCTDPMLAKELPGIHTARRFHQNGTPINRLVITWSLPQPPPSSVAFSFLPCLPSSEFRRMKDEQPWCYRCWNFGHISTYCSALERCAYCSETHDSRTCPHRAPPPPTLTSNSASMQPQPSTVTLDTSLWKCPRCHQPGVNVWHPGCSRRRVDTAPAANHTATRASVPPPPPHSSTPSTSAINSDSTQVTALRDAVATLQTRVASLVARFDTIETRLDSLVSKQATFETPLNSLAESQTVIIKTITELTERLNTIASRLETLTVLPSIPHEASPRSARVTTASGTTPIRASSSSASWKMKAKPR